MSVFGHYLDQGLSVRADGYPEGAADGRVSLRELARFVPTAWTAGRGTTAARPPDASAVPGKCG